MVKGPQVADIYIRNSTVIEPAMNFAQGHPAHSPIALAAALTPKGTARLRASESPESLGPPPVYLPFATPLRPVPPARDGADRDSAAQA